MGFRSQHYVEYKQKKGSGNREDEWRLYEWLMGWNGYSLWAVMSCVACLEHERVGPACQDWTGGRVMQRCVVQV